MRPRRSEPRECSCRFLLFPKPVSNCLDKTLSAQHRVEPLNTRGDALGRGFVRQTERGNRQYRKAFFVNKEWILVRTMRCAAILHNPHTARGNLILYAMIEKNDAVGDIFLEPVTCERSFAALAGDDGSHTFFFQPAKQAAQLGANGCFIRQTREECFKSIENNAFSAERLMACSSLRKRPSRSYSPVSSISDRSIKT